MTTTELWAPTALVAAADATLEGAAAGPITGFSIDTRSLAPGDCFVALTDQRDGHAFVTAAFRAGAAAALVRRGYQRQPGDGALIRVDDPLRALERIAAASRARLSPAARVIAVTGSAGKTGTKEMLRACLAPFGRVHAPEKSFNNHWGVPLTLARMPADTDYAVIEIGMNHAGEIRPLTRLAQPHVAIVTNVLPVHVGNFPDGETGVAAAKAEIFEGLESGGTAIILRDSPHFEVLRQAAERRGAVVRTFGGTEGCDARLIEATQDGLVKVVLGKGAVQLVRLGVPGAHVAMNMLGVLLAVSELGCNLDDASAALATLKPARGRGERRRLGTMLLIDESYNANPASMAAAMQTAAAARSNQYTRVVFVLGDMLELGEGARAYHEGLLAEASRADLVLTCGAMMRHLHDRLPAERRGAWAATSAELVAPLLAAVQPGDAVMIKGSLGSRMAVLVDALERHVARTIDSA